MKTLLRWSRQRRAGSIGRAQLLRAFDRSGMSAAAFARQYKINYTTFCGWRQRRAEAKPKAGSGFVQVELPAASPPAELEIELGAHARLCISSSGQIGLAAQLLQQLNRSVSC